MYFLGKNTALAIIFSLLWLNFSFVKADESICSRLFVWTFSSKEKPPLKINYRGANITVPIGMKPEHFVKLLETTFENEHAEGVLLWGSRTHFTRGYLPKRKSDLDFQTFYSNKRGSISDDEYFAHIDRIRSLKRLTGFKLNSSLRIDGETIVEFFRARYSSMRALSPQEEEAMFTLGYKLSEKRTRVRAFYPKKKMLSKYLNMRPGSGIYLNSECLVILRRSTTSEEFKAFLNERGFSNVFIID